MRSDSNSKGDDFAMRLVILERLTRLIDEFTVNSRLIFENIADGIGQAHLHLPQFPDYHDIRIGTLALYCF